MRRLAPLVKRVVRYLAVAVLGFVVGVAAIYVYMVWGGPPLQVWHTAKLTEEFTAGEVRTFDDYRRLEERLFAQLDEEVYALTETGTEFALARYTAGSSADPRSRKPDWNRSFELPAEAPIGGVLLLHGMTDSPYSLRALGERLSERGYWVIGLRLPGHGTAPSGMTTITWEDMAAAVRLAMEHLESKLKGGAIHVFGYSTGAPLALNHVLDAMDGAPGPVPASLVLISPAIGVTPAAALAGWKCRLAAVPGLQKFAWTRIVPEFDPYKYNSFATNAGYQVHRLTRSVAGRVETRARSRPIVGFAPTLVFLSTADATVSVDAVIDNLLEHLAPEGHELVLFDINRSRVRTTLLVADPGPLTARLLANAALPFRLTLIANASDESAALVRRIRAPMSAEATTEPLGLTWPVGLISLSHVALPIPPDDPLYGRQRPEDDGALYLGQIDFRGEQGLLKFPADWLMRLRYNPFYGLLEDRVLEWLDGVGDGDGED